MGFVLFAVIFVSLTGFLALILLMFEDKETRDLAD